MHWIKYHEHARTLPTNFVALGDAWMRLNPVWGQGCTLALMGATTLDGVLRAASGLAVGPAFFATLHTRLGGTWADMKARDYAYDACEPVRGEDRSVGAGRRAFAEMLGKRALAGDKDVQRRMLGVSAWVLPPTDMLAPSVLGKLALDWVLGR
jgi:2-polyprenyl-6-methoxyphenol hydroxylase-like FAD-dependent oxidoreductase